MDNVSVFFLAEGEQLADEVMARLTTFIRATKRTLDFAIYDMRFSDPLKALLSSALRERAEAGVEIRFCYDADKPFPPNVAAGQDPAPSGTGAFVQSLGYPWRRIAGMKLMHSKFVLRDGQTVWTGSANMTDDAFTLMENNVVEIDSQALASYYAEDFEQLWEKENFENTGEIHTEPVPVSFAGQPARVRVMFSPGCGLEIDSEVAQACASSTAPRSDLQLADQLRHADRRAWQFVPSRARRRGWNLRSHANGTGLRAVAGSAAKSMENRRAQRDYRAHRSDWEKLNALLGVWAPQLHAQQSSCDRRYCDHRLL
jgi:phosphatidylserine/phosphatidylglycerophosphate/cardiolipin synthase-like enzyme